MQKSFLIKLIFLSKLFYSGDFFSSVWILSMQSSHKSRLPNFVTLLSFKQILQKLSKKILELSFGFVIIQRKTIT